MWLSETKRRSEAGSCEASVCVVEDGVQDALKPANILRIPKTGEAQLLLSCTDGSSVLLGVVGKAWLGYAPNYLMLILVGVVANIFGQLGDLSMSLIKREAGIKDYSHLFLTHGGMLDRFDSSMFIAPIVWFAVSGGLL